MWAQAATQPDLSYAVALLARFQSNPGLAHWKALLHVLAYIKGTLGYRLRYAKDLGGSVKPLGYVDADYRGDLDIRRSTSGYIFMMAGGPVSWSSKHQQTVALSTTEAEYMALSDCSCQVVWMHTLLGELGFQLKAVPVCGDNQGSIFIASNPVTEKRSKHIDIRYHYIREVVGKGLVELYFIPGEDNPADLLTKNLGRIKFQKFRALLGLEFL